MRSAGGLPEMEGAEQRVKSTSSASSAHHLLATPLPSLSPSFARDMSEFPDYYAILSIPRTATAEDVRSAYKRESLRYALEPGPFDNAVSLILAADQDTS